MLPRDLQSAISTCVVNAFVKKANYRKKMRALIVKRAAETVTTNYKMAPSQVKVQKVTSENPVPGSRGREIALRPSLSSKAAFDAQSGQAPIPKMQAAPKPPGGPGVDTKFDLQNRQNSPGTNFFHQNNPVNAAMRTPDMSRLAPKPPVQRAALNQPFDIGTGPSGSAVQGQITPGSTMLTAANTGRTEQERQQDLNKFQGFRDRTGRSAVTMLHSPASRKAYHAARQSPAANPLTAPVDIPEMQQPTTTPVDLTSAPANIPVPPPSIPPVADVQAKAQQTAFPEPKPEPNYASMSPSQQLNAAQATAATPPNRQQLMTADNPANMSPNAAIANLISQLSQGAGRGFAGLQAAPNYLMQQMQSGNNPLARLFNSGMSMPGADDFQL